MLPDRPSAPAVKVPGPSSIRKAALARCSPPAAKEVHLDVSPARSIYSGIPPGPLPSTGKGGACIGPQHWLLWRQGQILPSTPPLQVLDHPWAIRCALRWVRAPCLSSWSCSEGRSQETRTSAPSLAPTCFPPFVSISGFEGEFLPSTEEKRIGAYKQGGGSLQAPFWEKKEPGLVQ